ncbi:ribonuclease D [Candidatus Nitromaritima sp. SCGC AAA799-C22]|nr:ribonuclease D [Candidatus Nitromaritima sp. SCGC AAA799-C22]
MYITTEDDLAALCDRLKSSNTLALDTEFVREKTYYHRLGLIQVSDGDICAAIDPIRINTLDPFLDLIRNSNTIKVFHAARQDLEILYRLCGDVVLPVFDTQIAASVVGWGSQISFAKIVHKVVGKKIHKSETYTDWCRRPLSDSQIEYALDDVRLLFPVYQKLMKVLRKLKREEWLEGEFKSLEDPENFKSPEPGKLFTKIKNVRSLSPRNLAVMYELAAWREEEARARDCLARNIVRDEPLLEIARKLPKDTQAMGQIRGFHRKEVSRSSLQILQAIQRGLKVPEDQIPQLPQLEIYSAPPGVEELLAAFVQIRADELKIEPSVLADRKRIHDFVKCYDQGRDLEGHPLFRGWRKEAIGSLLYSFLQGQQGLAIGKEGRLKILPLDNHNPDPAQ